MYYCHHKRFQFIIIVSFSLLVFQENLSFDRASYQCFLESNQYTCYFKLLHGAQKHKNMPHNLLGEDNTVIDHTCLFRASKEAQYILPSINDEKSENLEKKLNETIYQESFEQLPYNSFTYPKIYSALCKMSLNAIHNKIVYFNTNVDLLPLAGAYNASYIEINFFKKIKNLIVISPPVIQVVI